MYTNRFDAKRYFLLYYSLITILIGGVAQLGERLVRNEKVAGSIPVTSTKIDLWRCPPRSCSARRINYVEDSRVF